MGVEDTNWTLISWELCLKGLKIDSDVCFFGDSLTISGDFVQHFDNKRVCNLGIGGDTVFNMRRRVNMIAATHPKTVFVMGGINDLILGSSVEELLKNYQVLVRGVRELLPDANIYFQSILPINHTLCNKSVGKVKSSSIVSANDGIKKICEEFGVGYVDLYSVYEENGEMPTRYVYDGLHLKKEHYLMWYNEIEKYIRME